MTTLNIIEQWNALPVTMREVLTPLDSPEAYNTALTLFEDLMIKSCEDSLSYPESQFYDLLADKIKTYENAVTNIGKDANPIDVLVYLMETNDLQQKDLAPQFGSQSIVSEVLRGKRKINLRQAKNLADRFHLNPQIFLS